MVFLFAEHLAGCVKYGDGCSVHDALRTDVHIAASRHLSVLTYAQRIEPFPIVGLRIVGDNHTICYHNARCIRVRGEQT